MAQIWAIQTSFSETEKAEAESRFVGGVKPFFLHNKCSTNSQPRAAERRVVVLSLGKTGF